MNVDPLRLKAFFETQTLGSPSAAIGFSLWRLVHRYQREIDRALASLNLTHLQFTVLALVAWSNSLGEAISQAEVARQGEVEPMQLSQVIGALEGKGLVVRRPHPGNLRLKCAEITEFGLTSLSEAMPIAIDIQKRMFGLRGQPGGDLFEALRDLLTDGRKHR
ncbi:MarR family winged helix-turn-helix transcriptional regulator [Burkholderia cenocepacia]|uniref:MarR family winged helix-turn-helix transcriptional regulator n=1 Tax=Burkholderia cenocepacia TaxID=95486 RepID=UPI00163AB28A|nr:MarR family transcriptional regulator [Burkholderia cenocepacia]